MPKVRLTPVCKKDLSDIKEYISEELQNDESAKKTVGEILDKIDYLKDMPKIGSPLSAKTVVKTDYRYMVYGSYMIFYKENEQYVTVHRVLYARRDFMKILFGNEGWYPRFFWLKIE